MKRKAIVMGASSGLGREIAMRLLRDGWQVGVAARRREALESVSVEGVPAPLVAQIDVTDAHADACLRSMIESMGGVDLYFHVSGVGWQNSSVEAALELTTVDTNAMGFVRMVGEAFRWMAQHGGGHIAVVSSIAGTKGLAPAPAYSATKAFQNTYIQALEQLACNKRLGIKFTDIRPGFADTDLIRGTRYPMTMTVDEVVDEAMASVAHGLHVRVVDWRWRVAVGLWRLIPRRIWRHVPLVKS